jgi:signal transduction histidine kinase
MMTVITDRLRAMPIGVAARARLGGYQGTRERAGGQAAEAQRTSLAMLAAARAATLCATSALAFLSPTRDVWLLVGLAAFAVIFMVGTTSALWRSAERHRSWMVHVILTIDLATWLGACAASGANESYALMLYVVFPPIAAFVMTTPALAVSAVTIAMVRPLLGGSLAEILAFYGVALWAFAVAIAASQGRHRFIRRLRRLEAVWSELARGPSAAVRERVAEDLRHTALEPVRTIRRQVAATDPSPEMSAALVTQLRGIISRIREIAYELYAPPGLHGGVEASLRHLAQRRSASATVTVAVDGDLPSTAAKPLEALVRDALGLIAGPATDEIAIDVRRTDCGTEATIRASPRNDLAGHRRELRRAALMTRPGVADVRVLHELGGSAEVRARITVTDAPDPTQRGIHGVALRDTRGVIAAARLGAIPVVVGVPLLVGGTDPGYFWVAAATCVYLAGAARFFWTPRRDAWYYATLGADFTFLAGCLLLIGDARPYVLSVALLIPVAQSMVLPWTLALPVAAGTAVLLPLTGPTPQPAITIAVLWTAAISMMIVRERTDGARRLFAATERRNQLLQGLLESEDAERRRLAERLHDDVLQLLFGARQDLIEASDGSSDALRRADTTLGVVLERLTQTVSDLDVDEGAACVTGGLHQALTATARAANGLDAQVHVDPRAAGVHDGLLVQFARELCTNTVQHARATTVRLSVSRRPERIVLDVADDGVGFDFRQVDSAVARGGLGLATVRDRTTWSGGTVELGASEDGGARVRIDLPLSDR